MATTSIIKSSTRLLILRAYNLRSLCSRVFSNQNKRTSETQEPKEILECAQPCEERWLNIRAGIFGPDDKRLPLPGDIGMSYNLNPVISPAPSSEESSVTISTRDNLDEEKELEMLVDSIEIEVVSNMQKERQTLECRVQSCPKLLKKDFQSLFPNMDLSQQDMTVLTLCQKTANDMSGWSHKVEEEREQLIQVFVATANKLCESLETEGYWADFIDPTSGRPFIGPYTSSTLFETDERYRHFGFRIDDLGCCKVLTHKNWGANIFVGAIFTNAPLNSEILLETLEDFNMTPTLIS